MEAPPGSDLKAHDRLRKRWKLALGAGLFLCLGPLVGFLWTPMYTLYRIQTMKAPTPGDLHLGVVPIVVAITLGLLAGLVGLSLVVLARVRLGKLASAGASSREPWA